jgi:hypothetical protein
MRTALALCLTFALLTTPVAAQPAALPVRSSLDTSGAVVLEWPPVAGAALVCVVSLAGVPVCAGPLVTSWRQPLTPRDAALYLRPGDALEVRAWDAQGELIAAGRATIPPFRLFLPITHGAAS